MAWVVDTCLLSTANAPKRPLADILIGAFASRFDGILTRNEADFKTVFPSLAITAP